MITKSDYQLYLEKYCTTHKISAFEAERHYLVQSYKAYCEEKEAHERETIRTANV